MDSAAPSAWRDRIVGTGMMAPDQFLANPFNFRIHSATQETALKEVLDSVGWVRRVLVNRTTGHVLDGHLRVALAIRQGEPEIPYEEVELTEAEEKLVLAALDPIAGMAGTDAQLLTSLMDDLQLPDESVLKAMLADLAATAASHGAAQEPPAPSGSLSDRFLVPPFSVLNAREGWWQDRKAAWIALGIESELGRGGTAATPSHPPTITRNADGTLNYGGTDGQAERFDSQRTRRPNATPGGSTLPAADYSKSKARGDGRGKAIPT